MAITNAPAAAIDADLIPVIDVAALLGGDPDAPARVGREILDASERIGFFYVANHGVPHAVLDAAVAQSLAFFRRPAEEKLQVRVSPRHRGFIPVGEAKMYPGARIDLKESFVWGLDVADTDTDIVEGRTLLAPNRWPAFQPGLRDALCAHFDACHAIAWPLMRAFAVALGIDPAHFVRHIGRPVSRGSSVWYPPQPAAAHDEQFGVAPHTDYGCLTFVYQADVGGLEVFGRERTWVEAPPIDGTFVVNVGDLLARWTNDRFRSTPHRVVNRSGRERLSIAMFVDPDDTALVEPVCRPGETPRHAPVQVGDYIRGRYDASFAYRAKAAQAAGEGGSSGA
jgi:isopenicillin N synthase-like dioxygenase